MAEQVRYSLVGTHSNELPIQPRILDVGEEYRQGEIYTFSMDLLKKLRDIGGIEEDLLTAQLEFHDRFMATNGITRTDKAVALGRYFIDVMRIAQFYLNHSNVPIPDHRNTKVVRPGLSLLPGKYLEDSFLFVLPGGKIPNISKTHIYRANNLERSSNNQDIELRKGEITCKVFLLGDTLSSGTIICDTFCMFGETDTFNSRLGYSNGLVKIKASNFYLEGGYVDTRNISAETFVLESGEVNKASEIQCNAFIQHGGEIKGKVNCSIDNYTGGERSEAEIRIFG